MTDVSKEPFENHYVIQKELGRGKFATVYQCQKHTTSDLFAAKIVQTRSPKHVEEALTEVEILRACDHPCIVKVWDVFQSKNSLTIVLELIGGGELFEKLANEDTVSEGQAASYTKQVLDAMAHLHSLKIAHLDLKPENLMLSAKNSDIIKVVDFGLAKRMNKRVVCMQGTPEFVPPEVIALDPLSTYSDMWSVGVIVYIMVSGYSPFMGDDDNETYGNIAMCDYEFYEDEFAKISDECKDFIKSLLVMKPTDRMSATDALRHVWITSRDDNDTRIENQKIKRFLAQRKWKAIKKAFEATNKFNSLLSNMKRAAAVPNANSINITQAIVPSVNMDHRKLVVTEGDNISITAHVVSKPTCSWTKDGTALVVDKAKFNVIQSDCQSILVISKFTRQDEGSYTIACSNAAGTTTATIQLITLGPTD